MFYIRGRNFKKLDLIRILVSILLYIFSFACIFLPAGTFGLKNISFFLIIVITLFYNPKNFNITKNEFIFAFLMPTFFILLSFITNSSDVIGVISRGLTGYLLLISIAIRRFKINFMAIVLNTLKILSFIIIFLVLLDYFNIVDLNNNFLTQWFTKTENAMIGKDSNQLAFRYLIFFKSSPLLLLLLLYSLNKNSYTWSILSLISILLTGTRANFFVSIFVCFFYLIFIKKGKTLKFIILFLSIGFIILFLDDFIYVIEDIFLRKGDSDSVRTGHLESILLLLSNTKILIFGQGLSSYFFSTGIDKFTNIVELSYWDLLRQLGIVGFSFFTIFLIYLSILISKKEGYLWLLITLISYLIIAYTNPLLYSSTGYILFIVVMTFTYKKERIFTL
ncbi:hypothetical protein [Haploplasma modicum]|uniref:hypothetical protein n=1 Tax=Haploplasma modicum TaxID=2150 RepID=UPI00138AFE5B|nr:hypothetical protein [Haploplasma modicum]